MEKDLLVGTLPPIFHSRFALIIHAGLSVDQFHGQVIPSYTVQHPESNPPLVFYHEFKQ